MSGRSTCGLAAHVSSGSRLVLSLLVWTAAGAIPAWAADGEIEFLDFDLRQVLAPGSRLLRPGMHVHACGDDSMDVYVTVRVPLDGGIAVASRRATLRAFRTLSAFAYGSVGTRDQEVVRGETPAGGEAVATSIRNRVRTAGVVAGLRPAARVLEGESLLMVFVLALSGSVPTADCLPEGSTPVAETPESPQQDRGDSLRGVKARTGTGSVEHRRT